MRSAWELGTKLTALDILVLIAVFGAAVQGFLRGFVTEVLALFAWIAIVAALKLFHIPLAQALTDTELSQEAIEEAARAVASPPPSRGFAALLTRGSRDR